MGPKSGVAASIGLGYMLYWCLIFGTIIGIGAIAFDATMSAIGGILPNSKPMEDFELSLNIGGAIPFISAIAFLIGTLAMMSFRNKEQKYDKYFYKKYKQRYAFGEKSFLMFMSSIFIPLGLFYSSIFLEKEKILTNGYLTISLFILVTIAIIWVISSGKEAKDNLHIVETLNYRFNNIKKENISKLEMFLKICNEIPKDLNEDFTESIKLQFKKDLEA